MIPYRDFTYPLNVFMHILTHEEGEVRYLHYGLFEKPGDSIAVAQERSTELLLSRLPPPPARLLEAGAGLGTTLDRLTRLGYDAQGITPDEKQVAMAGGRVVLSSFEAFEGAPPSRRLDRQRPAAERERDALGPAGEDADVPLLAFDVIVFQESSQYINSEALFAKARTLAPRVLVLDEFATQPLDELGALHTLEGFLRAAVTNGFRVTEDLDLTAKAVPTIDYFRVRYPRYRDALVSELGVSGQQVDDLMAGAERYSDRYRSGVYTYRLLDLIR